MILYVHPLFGEQLLLWHIWLHAVRLVETTQEIFDLLRESDATDLSAEEGFWCETVEYLLDVCWRGDIQFPSFSYSTLKL